ncbi:hypothetical protein Tco_0000188 [Tanacetum coccineum]
MLFTITPGKSLLNIKEMRREETVNGAAVALPIETVKARFTNTLYGYFISSRLTFPLVENYVNNAWAKYGLKRIQLHEEFFLFQFTTREDMESVGLSLITTQIGRPIMLDTYTSNMCLHSWGRSTYARALIEISADMELKKSLVIAIPLCNKAGHTFATIDIEYEWIPPRCESCKNFDHISTKCPKLLKVDPPVKVMDDRFIEVKKKKAKTKQNNKRQVEGVRLTKPALNLQYRRVDKGETSKAKATNTSENKESNDSGLNKHHDATIKVATMNSFSALSEEDSRVWDDENRLVNEKENLQVINESDSEEVDEYITMDEYSGPTPKKVNYDQGASTPLNDGSSVLDITMREFKECVESIEVMDVQRTGLHFSRTRQNLTGQDGILKKMIVVTIPSVLNNSPHLVKVKPKLFKILKLVKKLKSLKKPTRKLMYDKDKDPSNVSLREDEAATVIAFNEALVIEEKFLKQKAKITWLKEGDSNSAYFHKAIKSRISRSMIDVVTDAEGVVFQNDDVAKAFISHYEVFLGQPGITHKFNTTDLFLMRLSSSEALEMVRTVSSQEDIIGPDVTRAVCEFFINGRLLRELNHTIIALIPKVNSPARVNDYRPISCCNVLFKCISKIIANRLKDSLKRCAFKVDIQKTYDTVDWEFLRVILIGFGFHVRMGKRGLRQGDPISPYLFTLIMEVLTLMLHRKTSTQLELLKEGLLDGFKDALGLVLSFPKSTNYFCNVLNHTKLAILHILPFEEGRLSVKYLGVPLSLSIAGRLQLIQSIMGSMHIYWASVFILPTRVLLDIEQLMRGFLWCQGNMRKGKAKVSWEAVCLPKDEGGLGVRRLDHFNKALMVSHVWKLLSLKESLWVKWIHVYKLKNRSFWDIPYRGNMTWGWRKILQLRPLIREFIWYCIGDGSQASMWFDRWCAASPIYNIVSSRDIFRAGFDLNSKVPAISVDKRDYLEWRVVDMRVMEKPFTVHLCVERYSVLRENVKRLKTQDLLNRWDVAAGLATVWSHLKQFAGLTGSGSSLASIMSILLPIAKRKSSRVYGSSVAAAGHNLCGKSLRTDVVQAY